MFKRTAAIVAVALVAGGCSTRTYFKLPEDTKVSVYERPQQFSQGMVTTRPFFWSSAGGIPYKLTDSHGTLVQQGKLRARFRVASIFWPPFAIIYWPMGFGQRCYDLTSAQPQQCTKGDLLQLRRDQRLAD
ncbi:hypothetical protein PSm6_36590 [Pseudomonas solani]|uniref:Lipoprotein n=1 Tax=Pseudomonas solani TaxID=2731552 RepID=A0ABM7LCJ2_9PSED|nr:MULTISPECIES: hypothetical protein [Pseudomonas]MDN4149324.1 hypothetical protein [Pseudomonas tohonis]MDU9415759.1 hypothetical protein [Pseudomonas sp. zfem005]WCD82068.1 hypothetical protein PI990_08635 [Pseudomonas sp. TUM22785]BCD87252.1 hypothetical protein PSm6_36590 [Pseudomonas solani]